MTMIDSAWKTWYRSEHDRRCLAPGTGFEDYATNLLKRIHPDFVNPDPMGSSGDGGCDGHAENGTVFYACYGADLRAGIDTADKQKDSRVKNKLESDFNRALSQWDTFTTWRFVTNASFGPKALKSLAKLQSQHAAVSVRPVTLQLWRAPDDLWFKAANKLTSAQLDEVMPGVPQSRDVELAELVELINTLETASVDSVDQLATISPVPATKMDFNAIPPKTRFEFNEGRLQSRRIDQWFNEQATPGLRDAKARRFRAIYEQARRASADPAEIVETIYVAIGGPNPRLSTPRANAVYAVTVYFFDSCDIFEEPPADYQEGNLGHAAAD